MLVPASEVVCFVKEEIIFLISAGGKKFITDYRSLDEVEELTDPLAFFRANRQFLIQLPYIDSIRSDESSKLYVKLKSQGIAEVIVSKEKAPLFRKWIEE